MAPLPRAYQWVDGSAYVNHVELVRKARGAEMPAKLLDRSADVSGRRRMISSARARMSVAGDEAWGIDLEGEVAVITDDVPMGTQRDRRRRRTSSW